MDNDTLVTSSGVIRNRSIPRVGIVNASSLYDDLFQDCLSDGIDLDWIDIVDETTERLKSENPELDDTDISEMVDSELQDFDRDSYCFLLGAWIKGKDGQYLIDKTGNSGSYALSYNTESGMVCVEWSQLTKKCMNTSPCYVMSDGSGPCGDLDTPGDAVVAYTLPIDMFRTDES
jgi:hypothetical protein